MAAAALAGSQNQLLLTYHHNHWILLTWIVKEASPGLGAARSLAGSQISLKPRIHSSITTNEKVGFANLACQTGLRTLFP